MSSSPSKPFLRRKHVASAIRAMANDEPAIAPDLRDGLRQFAAVLDTAGRITLKPRGKKGVTVSIPRAIGETIDQSSALITAFRRIDYDSTVKQLLINKIKQYQRDSRNTPLHGEAERLQLPYKQTADKLRDLIRIGWGLDDTGDPVLYPLDVVAVVLDKLSTLDGENANHAGEFCSVCFRIIAGDGPNKTCFLHRHDAHGSDRQAYASAVRRYKRYRELLAIPRPMHDFERFLLESSTGGMPQDHTTEWRNWVEKFDALLQTSLPDAHQQTSRHKVLTQCQSFEGLARDILRSLGDGTPISTILGNMNGQTNKQGPQPIELLGLLTRANLWFQVDNEFRTGVNRRRKIDIERLKTLNASGKTTIEIAAELEVTQQAVSVALRRVGIKAAHTRGRVHKPEPVD